MGVGGLGCSAAPVLFNAGIELTLCDFDTVEERNLGRQALYEAGDVGKHKVDVAAHRLGAATIHRVPFRPEMVAGHDVVLDCTDEPGTRALIHQACLEAGIPLAWAAVGGDIGQAAVVIPGNGPCLRCLWTGVGEPMACDDNTDAGALRRTGMLQGELAVQLIEGTAQPGQLHLLDESTRIIQFSQRSDCQCAS